MRTSPGIGDAFAGRGTSLNDTIASLEPLLRGLRPVARVLTEPDTRLDRLFPELGDAARIVAPVATQQAELFGLAARAFAAISADTVALQETISEGVPTLRDRDRGAPRAAGVPARLHRAHARAPPGRLGSAPDAAGAQRGDRGRDAGAPRHAGDERPPARRPGGAQRARLAAVDTRQPAAPRRHLRRRRAAVQVRRPGADGLQLLQLLLHLLRRVVLAGDDGRLFLSGRSLPVRRCRSEAEASVGAYSGLTDVGSCAPTARSSPSRSRSRTRVPTCPPGQHDADCQLGQRGYPLGAAPLPGQPASSPANLRLRPARVARADDPVLERRQERELVDTRVDSRQPETWKRNGK